MESVNFKDYPLVIMSCDSYSDIWKPLVDSFEKFWPHCPFPVYICSEEKRFTHPTFENIRVGERMSWAKMLITVLKKLDTANIIYLQEDYILKGDVSTPKLEELIKFYESNQAAYLRLIPFPPPDNLFESELNIGLVHKGSAYRTSLQAAIWDREVLLSLLVEEENGWEFERNSVERSDKIERPFYSLAVNSKDPNKNHHKYPLDYYSTAILQGKWQKEGVKILRKAGIEINTKGRGVLTRWDFYYYHQKKLGDTAWVKWLGILDRLVFNRSNSHRKF